MTKDSNAPGGPESAFRKVFDSATCAILIVREGGEIAYFSPFAEKLTGHALRDIAGECCSKLFTDDNSEVAEEIRRLFAGEPASGGCETPIVCRDGGQIWLLWNAQRLDDFEGGPAVLAIGHDISGARRAAVALKNREARLQAVLETAVDGIITIDEHGSIQSANPAAERIFGYSADEMLGRNIKMLMPAPYCDEHDQYLANYLRTGEKKIIGVGREAEGRRKDGSTFHIDIAVSEVPDGEQHRFTGIVRDITDRRQAETRFLQAERLAAIGQMMTGLAHESRNAFQRSQACLEMLELEVGDHPEALELIRRIQGAQDHLHHLYEEVRDYAAPIRLNREVCDLAQVWRDTWAHLEIARRKKKVALRETPHKIDLSCEVDPQALEQVFRNVLENAIAACREPGEIAIRCGAITWEGEEAVRVAFCDNGPGFSPEIRDSVFEPFFTTKTKGTGLGMAIAKRIVEAHGGEIAIGAGCPGAEVLVTLPRIAPLAQLSAQQAAARNASPPAASPESE